MKRLIFILVLFGLVFSFVNIVNAKTIRVNGYHKPSTGKYVNSYYKTSPNKSKIDNYSTKYNYNPYTGKKGYVNPYKY